MDLLRPHNFLVQLLISPAHVIAMVNHWPGTGALGSLNVVMMIAQLQAAQQLNLQNYLADQILMQSPAYLFPVLILIFPLMSPKS